MTLPWFLNPWAEVRRLERDVETWKEDSAYWSKQWDLDSRRLGALQEENTELKLRTASLQTAWNEMFYKHQTAERGRSCLKSENAELRRRIAEMDSCESGAENCGFYQSSGDLIQSLEAAPKRQMPAEEIEIQRRNYARSFKRTES